MSDNVRIIGIEDLDRKLRNPTWVSKPLGELFDKWRFATQRQAVANIKRGKGGWLDTGHDRRSITSERDMSEFPQFARVGSNSKKIRWGEYGTGLLSEDPQSSKRRHWPPSGPGTPLAAWATKRGKEPFLVARAIGMRGGLAPRRFLRDAVKTTEPKIAGWLSQMARDVEIEAEKA